MAMTKVRRYVIEGEPFSVWEDINSWLFANYGLPSENNHEWFYNTSDEYMDYYFVDPLVAEIFILKWM